MKSAHAAGIKTIYVSITLNQHSVFFKKNFPTAKPYEVRYLFDAYCYYKPIMLIRQSQNLIYFVTIQSHAKLLSVNACIQTE